MSVFGPDNEGIVCRVEACSNPDCACRDVSIDTIPIDDRVQAVEVRGSTINVYSDAIEGDSPRVDSEGPVKVLVDIDTGELALEDGSPADFEAMPRLYWLSEALDGELLEDIARFMAAVKGVSLSDDTPQLRRIILQDWEPGDKVLYEDVFAPVRRDLYRIGDQIYTAADMYCVKPECTCNEVTVAFGTIDRDPSYDPGAAHIDLTSGNVVFDRNARDPEVIDRLWALYLKRHGGLEYLAARQEKMHSIGPQLEAMWKAMIGDGGPSARPEKTIGRNDPCPCGSGKKYKKCCIVKKQ